MEFVLKTKMTKTSIQCMLWRNCIQRGLVVTILFLFRSLLFEGNASLKCVYSDLTLLSTVFQSYITTVFGCYREFIAACWFPFYTYNSGFPCAFICFSFIYMAKSKSDQRKGENWQKIQENNLPFWMAPRMIVKCKKWSPSARHILKT